MSFIPSLVALVDRQQVAQELAEHDGATIVSNLDAAHGATSYG